MKAVWEGTVIAESDHAIEIEGDYYFPPESINREYIQPGNRTSYCPWKGRAQYFSLNVAGETNENAAWCYADPKDYVKTIRGYFAFWKDVEIID